MSFSRLPPLAALRAFEAAGRLSSFKAAASELAVTPAAVSQQIRTLEEDLGVKLFSRGVRSVTLTEEGRRLQPALSAAFLEIRDAVDDIRAPSQRTLRVNASGPIIGKWLLPRLHRFLEPNPDYSVTIQSFKSLAEAEGDHPGVTLRCLGAPDTAQYWRKLCDEVVLPLLSPCLADRIKLTEPGGLADAPLLHDTSFQSYQDDGEHPSWAAWFSAAGLDPDLAKRGAWFDRDGADHAIDAAVNGAGVVLGRRFLAHEDLRAGRLLSPFGPILPTGLQYFVTCRAGDETLPEIAAFLGWLCQEIAEMAAYDGLPAPHAAAQ